MLDLSGIYEVGPIFAICALPAVSLLYPGMPILLRTDNSAAAPNLVRGNCAGPPPLAASQLRRSGPPMRR